jgi:hypothetical protein
MINAYSNAVSGAVEGTLGKFMGVLGFGGGPPDPRSKHGKAKYGKIYEAQAQAAAQGAAKSGRVQLGLRKKGTGGLMGDFLSTSGPGGTLFNYSPTDFLERFNAGRGPSYDNRAVYTASRRHTGGDAGPGFFLTQYQGSNRGSGNWQAQVPRYSVQETRTSINKYDKANFVRLGKHVDKKYLAPGTEQMMVKKPLTTTLGGARAVTRKFL